MTQRAARKKKRDVSFCLPLSSKSGGTPGEGALSGLAVRPIPDALNKLEWVVHAAARYIRPGPHRRRASQVDSSETAWSVQTWARVNADGCHLHWLLAAMQHANCFWSTDVGSYTSLAWPAPVWLL